MKKLMAFLVMGLLLVGTMVTCAQAEVQRNPILDTAFSCLEKDNIFLRRYNELTGADVQPLFEAGIPYFFGGQDTKKLFASYPYYAQRDCLETAGHYIKGVNYLFGFDCSGFCRYVYAENDLGDIDTLSNMILHHCYYLPRTWVAMAAICTTTARACRLMRSLLRSCRSVICWWASSVRGIS